MSSQGSEHNVQPPEYEVDESGEPRRVRALTEKGQELYEKQTTKLKTKLVYSWEKVQRYISETTSDTTPITDSDIVRKCYSE